jgi:hypothetical protein
MSATDKDLHQKTAAIQFCVSLGIVPFYEVNVSNVKDLSDKPEVLTDIDVVGLSQNHHRITRTLFDCKTTKASPINRAFWAAGVAKYAEADDCYVILKRSAPEAHRISAKSLCVHLFDEAQFKHHALALSPRPPAGGDYMVDMRRWHALHEVFRSNPPFERLGEYLRHVVPLETDAPKIVRGIIANMRQARGEFDPAKPGHIAVFCYCVVGFAIAMATVARDIFDAFDPKQPKDVFQRFLRDYIWGGREAYQLRKKLREVMALKTDQPIAEFELHGWDDFVELVRALLDAPEAVFLCALPITGLTLRILGADSQAQDGTVREQLSRSNRQRQFSFRLSSYLIAASGLPKEFDEVFKALLNSAMTTPSSVSALTAK